jgi:hypothetical protein
VGGWLRVAWIQSLRDDLVDKGGQALRVLGVYLGGGCMYGRAAVASRLPCLLSMRAGSAHGAAADDDVAAAAAACVSQSESGIQLHAKDFVDPTVVFDDQCEWGPEGGVLRCMFRWRWDGCCVQPPFAAVSTLCCNFRQPVMHHSARLPVYTSLYSRGHTSITPHHKQPLPLLKVLQRAAPLTLCCQCCAPPIVPPSDGTRYVEAPANPWAEIQRAADAEDLVAFNSLVDKVRGCRGLC